MSHQFESGFFVRRAPWHRLGTILNHPPTTKEAITYSGLDWQVLEKTHFQPSSKALFRKKLVRDRDQKILATVPCDYVPLQNKEAFRWFDPLLEKGDVTLEAAGSLQGGKQIWVLAKLSNLEDSIRADDPIHPYLLLHNSHDGSSAVWLQFTPVRVVCMNTLARAAASRFPKILNKQATCISHTASLKEQIEKIQKAVNLAKFQFMLSIKDYKAMESQSINNKLLATYLGSVLGSAEPQKWPEWSQIVNNFEHGQGNRGKTLWDAYNGITEWIDHQQEIADEERLWSIWFGDGAALRERAHQAAMALIKECSRVSQAHRPMETTPARIAKESLTIQ